jgi:hydroxymethylglutaryl-CoA lyase
MATLPSEVKIIEVGPRDGLQNEPAPIATDVKVAFIRALCSAGLRHIEATSFVNTKAIPQLADALAVARGVPKRSDVTFSALVPNQKGLDQAIEGGIQRIAVFTAASETFTKKNIKMTIDESLAVFAPVVSTARAKGISVRGYVSTCFFCPFEGEIDKEKARGVAQRLLDLGCDEIAISDTIGAAAPTDIQNTVGHLLRTIPRSKIALHLHDTYGTALANVLAGLELGIATFDASAGGLGGCPYAPGAAGNLATEDLVYMLERMGIRTGVDLLKLIDAVTIISGAVSRPLTSKQWLRLKS